MDYLATKQIYHGDLATRNILLTDSLDAKISDFGLSKRIYNDISAPHGLKQDEYEILKAVPIKWVALEVLLFQEFVPVKSDIWSYGVVIWEIFSGGCEPYGEGILLNQLIYQLSCGHRLTGPKNCPLAISSIMKQCFQEKPNLRPDFCDIKKDIESEFQSILSLSLSCEPKQSRDIGALYHPINKVVDSRMQEQYAVMIKKNTVKEIIIR